MREISISFEENGSNVNTGSLILKPNFSPFKIVHIIGKDISHALTKVKESEYSFPIKVELK